MKIMFICTGNICRSAMAHRLLEDKIKKLNIDNVEVYSCGIYAQEGDIPTWEARSVMKEEFDIDISTHRAIYIKNSNIEQMDLILCATQSHKAIVQAMYPNLKEKIYTMKEYVGYNREYHNSIDIKDPWGYDKETYRSCVAEIEECINLLLNKIEQEK